MYKLPDMLTVEHDEYVLDEKYYRHMVFTPYSIVKLLKIIENTSACMFIGGILLLIVSSSISLVINMEFRWYIDCLAISLIYLSFIVIASKCTSRIDPFFVLIMLSNRRLSRNPVISLFTCKKIVYKSHKYTNANIISNLKSLMKSRKPIPAKGKSARK